MLAHYGSLADAGMCASRFVISVNLKAAKVHILA